MEFRRILLSEENSARSEARVRADGYASRLVRTIYHMATSESRVLIFVWAIVTSYLLAADLHPDFLKFSLLVASGYLLTLGGYTINAVVDLGEDKINSPARPLASGKVRVRDALTMGIVCIASSIILSLFVSIPTAALLAISLFLGIAYVMPRIEAKRRFPAKLVVTACGCAVFSLAGGVAAQNLNATIFFAAVAFALFALVTLLLGDISDLRGDAVLHVKSLPVVLGPRRAIFFVIAIPLVLSGLGVMLFRFTSLNLIFPFLLISASAYSSFTVASLLRGYEDPNTCRKIKSRMRIMHFVIQLTFILGLLPL